MGHNDPFELYDEKREPFDGVPYELYDRWNMFLIDLQFLRPEYIYEAVVNRWEYDFTKGHYKEFKGGNDEGAI